MSVINEFMRDLSSYNRDNFSRFQPNVHKELYYRQPTYLVTKDKPPTQVIVAEPKQIRMRYLHQYWDKKDAAKKRELSDCEISGSYWKKSRP
ncbi:hypothetical protein O3M35_004326 [Rhynocoris fuscipes]|uniref:DET1- and DDB1-associated protein 1 n=1 Tax=Rhynocoris fuscipes TaxID=488301 RepID=A0AAW1CJK7_9HEMI